jgi:ppGpp synthetase/RelA/SpoT-type nucleotidyltranferase
LYALKAALERAAIKYHSLPSRVKSPESFLDKVKRRETSESEEIQHGEWDPLKEVQDIVGLRVVCLYLSDVERIATVVRNTFQVLSEDNKIQGAEVSSFGYMSVHFVAIMKAEYITSLLASRTGIEPVSPP